MAMVRSLNRATVVLAAATGLLVTTLAIFKYQNTTTSTPRVLQGSSALFRFTQQELAECSTPSPVSREDPQGELDSSQVRGMGPQGGSAPSQVRRKDADGQVLRERAKYLQQVCQQPEVRQLAPSRPWTEKRMVLRPFPLCLVPKGGSIAWRIFLRQLSDHVPGSRQDLKALVTRHPLSRLASVYRDKYLNGSPLMTYNRNLKTVTGSFQTWRQRWALYWFPALIHKGLVKPSPKFLKVINETSEAFKFILKYVNASGHLNLNTSIKEVSNYAPKVLDLATMMLYKGRHVGMAAAVAAGYRGRESNEFQRRFRNASFSFVEFLEHVLWTWDLGLVDNHWTPISELCNPCGGNYSYILHLENPVESTYLLGLLQTPNTTVPKKHVSVGSSKTHSDLWYYKDVSKDLMSKIYECYKGDFYLFGYDENHI